MNELSALLFENFVLILQIRYVEFERVVLMLKEVNFLDKSSVSVVLFRGRGRLANRNSCSIVRRQTSFFLFKISSCNAASKNWTCIE